MSAQAIPRAAVRARRVDLRVVAGLLLFVLGILGTTGLVREANERTPVLVAARALAPGETVQPSDLRVAEVGLAPGVATVPAADVQSLVGRMVTTAVEEGQVIPPAVVAETFPAAEEKVAVSVEVPPARAAGGTVSPGDRVMLFATKDPGRPLAQTTMLLSSVEVLAVEAAEGPGVQPTLTVTLGVLPENAQRVVQATNAGIVDLVLLPRGADE
ncbi:MAG: Flp pilus assembly protein CpaB [Actinomycetota bacterium]|nr:Flp pilus assembly protein CpaB [Actinomycetota bacterium]